MLLSTQLPVLLGNGIYIGSGVLLVIVIVIILFFFLRRR